MPDTLSFPARTVYDAFNQIGLHNESSFETDRKALAAALRAASSQLTSTKAIDTLRDIAADLLERLSPPQPVPVSERLPGAGDCDAEGRCWCFAYDGNVRGWTLRIIEPNVYDTHWLPAHALPVAE